MFRFKIKVKPRFFPYKILGASFYFTSKTIPGGLKQILKVSMDFNLLIIISSM